MTEEEYKPKNLNNHYVPRFIIRHFGDSVNCFNVRTGEFLPNRTPESVFCGKGIYPDDLERKFNNRIEQRFSEKLWKILDKDEIILKRSDIWLIKRFLLITTLRTPNTENFVRKFRQIVEKEKTLVPEQSLILYGKHVYDADFEETDTHYWNRTVECILNNDEFTTGAIDRDPNGTAMAHYFIFTFNAGYLGFWDAADTDEFVITDVGMTSENEIGWSEDITFIPKKMEFTEFLLDNLTNDSEELKYGLSMLYCWVTAFHENFYLFPISSKRTIVLVNPFFKFILMNSDTFRLDFSEYTILNDKRLFLPNKSTCYSLGEHKDDDTYTYMPVQLTPFETRYCNCLIMDRIDTWLGFSSLDAVRGSAEQYREMTKGYARNAYAELYDILSKSRCKY